MSRRTFSSLCLLSLLKVFLKKFPVDISVGRLNIPQSTNARRALLKAPANRERSDAGAALRGGSSANPLARIALYDAINQAASCFWGDSSTMHL